MEQWRDVPGFEGFYQVSNIGQVKSLSRIVQRMSRWGGRHPHVVKERIMAARKVRGFNYVAVNLTVEGAVCRRLVHRLVLEAFVGPCPDGMEARHFPDRDTANNRLDNLSWGTPKENAADRVVHGTDLTGRIVSNETRAKLSAAHKGRKLSEEHKAKIGAAGVGRRHSAITRFKIGQSQIGKVITMQARQLTGAALRGRRLTAEHRAKIAAGLSAYHGRRSELA